MPITQLNRFSYRMTRLVVYVCVLALVAGCGTGVVVEDPCGFDPPRNEFKLEVNNSSDVSVDITTTKQQYDTSGNARSVYAFDESLTNYRFLAQTHTQIPVIGLINICSGVGLPAANRMAYPLFLLTLNSAGKLRHYLVVGGSQHDYETYVRDQLTLPAGTEILGYGYLYTPGETIRQELGLQANDRDGTSLYTDLIPKGKNPIGSTIVVLRLKIEGDNSSDMHWSFSNDFKYKSPYDHAISLNTSPQSTNQAYPASGSSGSSADR